LYVAKFIHADIPRINAIIKTLKILQANDVPVLIPLQAVDKNYFVGHKGYQVQLTPYIQAQPFSFDSSQMLSSGATLKKFHKALKNYNEISNPTASIYPSTDILRTGLHRLRDLEKKIPLETISHIHHLYEKIIIPWENISKRLPQTVIHGDWNERNMLFNSNGNVECIFDFDYIQRKERLFDVAFALWNFFIHPSFHSLAEPFMRGYGHLWEQEQHILHHAVARVSFFFICTASLSQHPVHEVNHLLHEQLPFIEYILSKQGKKRILELCNAYKTK
jgi:Ser/Thr protein kinase RdoA (MazF antagonist)